MSPIPVVLCGKDPTLAKNFCESMLPEYEVTYVLHTAAAAVTELPSILSAKPFNSSSGLGTQRQTAPKAIIVGRGYGQEEIDAMRAVDGAHSAAWLVPDLSSMPPVGTLVRGLIGGKPSLAGSVAERAKDILKEHGVSGEKGPEAEVGGQVWYF
ncbi:hypothetical protein LTR28_005679 [Elasticomyces elasticus]|nr:hypothetical protein LTR28_005679 [Elasticomyces elasticus]